MREICVVVSADNTYAKHLGVMLYSLLTSVDSGVKLSINVLDGGIYRRDKNKISDLVSSFGSSVQFIDIDKEVYDKYPVSNHIRPSAYFRIAIQDVLNHSCRKAIYLDCDMIIKDDISKIWDVDNSHYILSAVEDSGFENNDRLFMPRNILYFNSGVMLINLDNWRKNDISAKTRKFIQEYPDRLLLHDQDALNAVICGNWQKLHPRWNQQTKMFRLRSEETTFTEQELSEALHSPAIIHFTESSKPWHYMNEHPFRDEYYKFLQCTEWKYRFPQLQKHINILIKPIIGVAYKLLDYLKVKFRYISNLT